MTQTNISRANNFFRMMQRELPVWMPATDDFPKFAPRFLPEISAQGLIADAEPPLKDEEKGGPDMFGMVWEFVPMVGGAMIRPGNPLMEDANDWPELVRWPDIDAWDWAGGRQRNESFIQGKNMMHKMYTGFFERLMAFMNCENALIAMIDEDQHDAVQALFERLADLYCRILRRLKATFPEINLIYFHEDWGTQLAPFFRLDVVMDLIVPPMKKVVDCTHELGMIFQHHCCGKNEPLVPAMIAAGVDIWSGQPINDKAALYRDYGDKLILGIDPPPAALDPSADHASQAAAAEWFVNEYCTDYARKPCLLESRGCNDYFRACVEEKSAALFAKNST